MLPAHYAHQKTRRITLLAILLVILFIWGVFCLIPGQAADAQGASLTAADPNPLGYAWHTFLGIAGGQDRAFNVATDADGNIYLVGEATVSWLGPGNIAPLHAHSGSTDVVIVKLDPDGNYLWHTFYGGSDGDDGYGIALDASGNLYVTGFSIFGWNGPQGQAPLHPFTNFWNLYVLKLNASGAYLWHTFYGKDTDFGYGLALDGLGGLYVVGQSFGTWQGDGDTAPLHPFATGIYDMLVLKLNTDGAYQWHTYYGSSEHDVAWEVAADSSGNVYLTGNSPESWLGDGDAAPLHAFAGGGDMTVLKLNSAGAYLWHTFWGGTNGDDALDLALDASGNVYITGASHTAFFGSGSAAPRHAFSGGETEITVLKLSQNGAYLWHTFYGAAEGQYWEEAGHGIAVGADGLVAITGHAAEPWNGDHGTPPVTPFNGPFNTFLLFLNADGAYQHHRFYGFFDGYTWSHPEMDLTIDASGNVITAGFATDGWLGDGGVLPLNPHTGWNYDIQVIKLTRLNYAVYLPSLVR